MEDNNFVYKWKKIFASKRFDTKDGVITLTPEEQQELLDDAGPKIYCTFSGSCLHNWNGSCTFEHPCNFKKYNR